MLVAITDLPQGMAAKKHKSGSSKHKKAWYRNGKEESKGSFKACPNSPDKYVKPWSLSYKPETIVAKKGEKISVHFDAQVLKEIPKGVKVEVKVTTKGSFPLPIPCLEVRSNGQKHTF